MKKLTLTLFFLCFSLTGAFPTVTTINSKIDSLMKLVDIDTLEYYIRYLQDLGPRPRKTTHPDYPNNVAAKKWLYQQYKNIGNLDVYFHHFLSAEQCDTF